MIAVSFLPLLLAGAWLAAAPEAAAPAPDEARAEKIRALITAPIAERVPRLAERLASPRDDERAAAAGEVASLRDPGARPILLHLLGDPAPAVGRYAIQGLGLLGDPADHPLLAPFLKDPSPETRAAAARAIAAIGGTAAAAGLRSLLKDKSDKVRFDAVQRLLVLRDAEGLVEALADPLKNVRALAASGLVALGERRAVAIAAQDPDPEVRKAVALSLGRLKSPWGIPLLIPQVEDPDGGVRFQAATALFSCAGVDLGFEIDLTGKQRHVLRERWERWWAEVGSKRPEPAPPSEAPAPEASESILLTRAAEATAPDRLRLVTGEEVRLLGVSAPRRGEPAHDAAAAGLWTLAAGQNLLVAARRSNGRYEGWVWAGAILVQEEILRRGLARRADAEIPPVLSERLAAAEAQAKAAGIGVWRR